METRGTWCGDAHIQGHKTAHPLRSVRTDRLTPDRAARVRNAPGPATGYLWRLVDRLVEVGLDTRDPKLTQLATAARDARHALGVELHYQKWGHVVGRRSI
jgi:hypothetical protein